MFVGQNSLLTSIAGVYGEGVGFEFFKNLGMGWGDGKVGTILGRPEAIGCHVTYTRAAAGRREEESTG